MWTEGQDKTNNIKIFKDKMNAGSAFLKSSTAHHHPDEFCHRETKTHTSASLLKNSQTKAGNNIQHLSEGTLALFLRLQ